MIIALGMYDQQKPRASGYDQGERNSGDLKKTKKNAV
jgi:hypothetical protein